MENIPLGDGREIEISRFSAEEKRIFDRDYKTLVAMYNDFPMDRDSKHAITSHLMQKEIKETFEVIGQAAKKDILPSAGQFQGMRATTGYGFQLTRPDHMLVAAQGRTFDVALAALTKDNWYGLYHNGAIGAAYNATPLYLRKELCLGLAGLVEVGQVAAVEEFQLELSQKPLPIYNCTLHMRDSDSRFFPMPKVEYFEPAIQYRSAFKTGVVAGNAAPVAVGITFITAEWMRTQQPTQVTTAAP